MLFSIITPLYESISMMNKYFSSISMQKIKNFEVIIIDDHSSENVYNKLIEELKEYDFASKVIRLEENSGPGFARNIGLKESSGDWITFIDNDDWIDDNTFQDVENIISKHSAIDCIVVDYSMVYLSKEITMNSLIGCTDGFVNVRIARENINNHTWGKFYKREILVENNILFPNLRRCEDIVFTTMALGCSNSIYYLKKPLYKYFQRQNSLSNNTNMGTQDLEKAFRLVENFLKTSNQIDLLYIKSIKDYFYGMCLIKLKEGMNSYNLRKFTDLYNSQYPDWKRYLRKIDWPLSKKVFLYSIRFHIYFLSKLYVHMHSRRIK